MVAGLEQFIAAFKTIGSPQELGAFIDTHRLTEDGLDQRPGTQVYRVVGGVVAGEQVRLTYRWHDPSQAFAIRADIAKVDLEVNAKRVYTVEWPEEA